MCVLEMIGITTIMKTTVLLFLFVLCHVCIDQGISECSGTWEVVEGSPISLTCTISEAISFHWFRQEDYVASCKYLTNDKTWQCNSYVHNYKATGQYFSSTLQIVNENVWSIIDRTVQCEGIKWSGFDLQSISRETCNISVVYPAGKVVKCHVRWNSATRSVYGFCDVDKIHDNDKTYYCLWSFTEDSSTILIWNRTKHELLSSTANNSLEYNSFRCRFSEYHMPKPDSPSIFSLEVNYEGIWMFVASLLIDSSKFPTIHEAKNGILKVKEKQEASVTCRPSLDEESDASLYVSCVGIQLSKGQGDNKSVIRFTPQFRNHNGVTCTCTATTVTSRGFHLYTVVSVKVIVEREPKTTSQSIVTSSASTTFLSVSHTPTHELPFSTSPSVIDKNLKKRNKNDDDENVDRVPLVIIIAGTLGGLLIITIIVIILVVLGVKGKRKPSKGCARRTDTRDNDYVEHINSMYVSADELEPNQPSPPTMNDPHLPSSHNLEPVSATQNSNTLNLNEETSFGYSVVSFEHSQPSTSRGHSASQSPDVGHYSLVSEDDDNAGLEGARSQTRSRNDGAVVRKSNSERNDYAEVKIPKPKPKYTLDSSLKSPTHIASSQDVYVKGNKKSKGRNPVDQRLPETEGEMYGKGKKTKPTAVKIKNQPSRKGNVHSQNVSAKVEEGFNGSDSVTPRQTEAEGKVYTQVRKATSASMKRGDEAVLPKKPSSTAFAERVATVNAAQKGAGYENVDSTDKARSQMQGMTCTANIDDEYNALDFHRGPPSRDRDVQYSHIGALRK